MKVLVIPDVHLKPWMFEQAAVLMREKKADRAVCLMDIPDDWGKEYDIALYEQTYDAAIDFAKEFFIFPIPPKIPLEAVAKLKEFCDSLVEVQQNIAERTKRRAQPLARRRTIVRQGARFVRSVSGLCILLHP